MLSFQVWATRSPRWMEGNEGRNNERKRRREFWAERKKKGTMVRFPQDAVSIFLCLWLICMILRRWTEGESRRDTSHTHTHTDVHLSSPTKPNSLRGSKATPFCFGPIGADTDRHHCNALHWFSSTRSSSCPSDVQKETATVAKGHFLRNTRICYGLDKSC